MKMRWRDIDGLGHVNHTVVLTYLEEGRDAFLESRGIHRDKYVVGRCSVTYLREIKLASATVTVQCVVERLGISSITTTERVFDSVGEAVVEAEFGLVMWDSRVRHSRPITDKERTALTRPEGEEQ